MEDLMEWLLNYAFDHQIGVTLADDLSPTTPSSSYGRIRLAIINQCWHRPNEVPFSLAHEISHILNGDQGNYSFTYAGNSKEEYLANSRAIDLIITYCRINDIKISSSVQFCEQFGIPMELDYLVEQKL